MRLPLPRLLLLLFASAFCLEAHAQGPASGHGDNAQLEALTKKIDEQNLKIDALSQQMLKLEGLIANIRPGVMIGDAAPATAAASAIPAALPVVPQSGNAHVVAKGETLTSIAKAYKVGVTELQKFNQIENDRALQIGKTIMIPTPGGASPAPSPSSTP